jgi:hypothetical protein
VTESEWVACQDTWKMLAFLGNPSPRKLRLACVGYCRCRWELLHPLSRQAVEVAERYADGLATTEELLHARWLADSQSCTEDALHQDLRMELCIPHLTPEEEESLNTRFAQQSDRLGAAMMAHLCCWDWTVNDLLLDQWYTEHRELAALLRDIFGNPWPPVSLVPGWLSWHDGYVQRLAETIYASHDFSAMPILADALEEAGCTEAALLGHLRGPGPHVRGCWALDAILGKE